MQKNQKYQLACQTHNQLLNLVCLDENCEKRGLLCAHCQYKDHSHSVKALGLLLAEVDKDIRSYQTSIRLLSQLDNLYAQIQESIDSLQCADQKKAVKQMASSYYTFHIDNLHKKHEQSKQFRNSPQYSVQNWNEFLLNYNFVQKQSNPNNYTNFQHEIHSKLQEFQNSLKEVKQCVQNNDSIQKILKIFEVDLNKKVRYFFNSEKSHKDIIVIDKNKAELKEGYSYRIGLLDPPIKKQNAKLRKKTITFKINKVTAMVGVGVIYKKKVQTANYLFSAYSQHGCYLITNSGYTYNESNPTFNSQMKNWNYTTNDIIKVTVEPKEKKILFEKEGKDVFQLPFEEKADMELNFGVLLCQQNQSVQIM